MITRLPLGLALVLVLVGASPASTGGDWTGKTIFTKKTGTKLSGVDAAGKKGPEVELTYGAYQVIQEKDGKLRIRHNAVEGWLDKGDAVVAEEAVEFFNERIKDNPKDAPAHAKRAMARVVRGEMDPALKDLEEALRLDPKLPSAWEFRGTIAYLRKDSDQAVKDLSEAIRIDPDHLNAYLLRAFALGSKGEFDAALKDFDEVIRIDPTKAEWWQIRGMAHAEKKNYGQAQKDLDAAIKLDPKLASAYLSRGQLALQQKDPDRALKDFDQALKLDMKSPEVYGARARAWINKKDFGNAIKELEESIRIDPKSSSAYNSLAWLLATSPEAKVRNGKRAIELATKACELTNFKNSNDVDTLAAAYAEAGQFDEAVRFQMQALEDPNLTGPAGDEFRERLDLYKKKMPYREK